MAEDDSLSNLQDLHRDLLALSESRLPVLDRLWAELEARIEDFKSLLDQKRKDEKSRQQLGSGKITIDDVEYTINEDFRDQSIQLANALDLDELESARLLLIATNESQDLDRSPFVGAIIRFQQKRRFLLECLRLAIKESYNDENEPLVIEHLRQFKNNVFQRQNNEIGQVSQYWRKCLGSMAEIEKRLQDIHDRFVKLFMTNRTPTGEVEEIVKLEKDSLWRQHESLAGICCYIVRDGVSGLENYHALQEAAQKVDKHDAILIHYIPMFSTLIEAIAPMSSTVSLSDARKLHTRILSSQDSSPWAVRNFQAAMTVWWLAEYSGRYVENPIGSPIEEVDLEREAADRSKIFLDAIKDGAFHFILSVCQDMRPNRWYDPARAGLVSFLLRESATLPSDTPPFSEDFERLVMDQFQGFVDAFITNMPDSLRKLKVEEDEQRRQLQSRFQRDSVEYELHLERFLVIVCFAYDGSPEAGASFWNEPDGNLYGFLQWAAKRQTTPRVAAFCEMLRAISVGEECAECAHRFLQEEGQSTGNRLRRSTSLSYSQIFAELQYYSTSVKDKGTGTPASSGTSSSAPEQIVEQESGMMLESYLRLLAHLCSQSPTAREWVTGYPNIVPMLFSLCQTNVESRLRASAFGAMTSFLTAKHAAASHAMWTFLDSWVHTGLNIPAKQTIPTSTHVDLVWTAIAGGYEESNAFVELLRVLAAPSIDDSGLHDSLSFPETLGANHRMPGIEIYVDFVMGRLFPSQQSGLTTLQLRIMRWNCLNFISTCLSTFNENLVVLAHVSKTDVDQAIQASSLAAYVQLHPFARIMEWLLNERVLMALLDAAHQDADEVNDAPSDSPLVLSLLSSIEVMNKLMSLQSTYLDIVRPHIKMHSTQTRQPVSTSAIASFEDAVTARLSLIVDLGLYCGTGHHDLTVESLRLLEKLSISRKVNAPASGFASRSGRNRILTVVEQNNDAERIARALVAEMQIDYREVEAGPGSSGYAIKRTILDFLNSALEASPSRPSLAHLLLGFTIFDNQLGILEDSPFSSGESLFHSIVQIAVYYPDGDQTGFRPWLLAIKRSCLEVLMKLWRSPLTSELTMIELRRMEFFFDILLRQKSIDPETLWDGLSTSDPGFFALDSALAFQDLLIERTIIYDYLGREIRAAAQAGIPSMKAKVQSALLGLTVLPSGESINNPSIFDLFDFMELPMLEPAQPTTSGTSGYMKRSDFDIYRNNATERYELRAAAQVMTLHLVSIKKENAAFTEADEQRFVLEAQQQISDLTACNQYDEGVAAQQELLKTWAQTVAIMLDNCDFEDATKTNFILQTMQIILPRIQIAYQDNDTIALELLRLARTLIQHLNFSSLAFQDSRTGEFASDRTFQTFKAALAGVYAPVANAELREICYQICYRYHRAAAKDQNQARKHMMQAVELAGDHHLEVLCEDALTAHGTCRVSALLFFESLVALSNQMRSRYVMERLLRINFITLCMDSIKTIPEDLEAANANDVSLLLSYYEAELALLLRVCSSRDGATHVLNSGLFQAIKDSRLFTIDADIGLAMQGSDSLKSYFDLLLGLLRVINAALLSKGSQNQATLKLGRHFLEENRATMVAVLKRNANIGGIRTDDILNLDDLVDNFTLLITATGFLDYEDNQQQFDGPRTVFS